MRASVSLTVEDTLGLSVLDLLTYMSPLVDSGYTVTTQGDTMLVTETGVRDVGASLQSYRDLYPGILSQAMVSMVQGYLASGQMGAMGHYDYTLQIRYKLERPFPYTVNIIRELLD